MPRILIVSLTLLLAGCQSIGVGTQSGTKSARIPVGSVITLHQPLSFEIGYSRSYIQFGKPIKPMELRKRYPYCRFYRYEHPDEMQAERTMQPDTFRVTRSYRAMDLPLSGGSGGGLMLGPEFKRQGPRDDNTLNNIFKIESRSQPEIVELRCAVLTEPTLRNYLTLEDIQQALGELVSINLP